MADDWEILEVLGSEEDAELICGFLRNQGVPCQVESAHSHEFVFSVGALSNVRVEVPADRVEEARRLLAEIDSTPLADEGDEGADKGEGYLATLRRQVKEEGL
jgi:hypothetical protein